MAHSFDIKLLMVCLLLILLFYSERVVGFTVGGGFVWGGGFGRMEESGGVSRLSSQQWIQNVKKPGYGTNYGTNFSTPSTKYVSPTKVVGLGAGTGFVSGYEFGLGGTMAMYGIYDRYLMFLFLMPPRKLLQPMSKRPGLLPPRNLLQPMSKGPNRRFRSSKRKTPKKNNVI